MSRVEHLAHVERLRLAEFPVEPCRTSGGWAGPGFSLTLLPPSDPRSAADGRGDEVPYGESGFAGADGSRPGARAYEFAVEQIAVEQYAVEQATAEAEALGAALARRWGEPFRLGLDGLLLRRAERGEELPSAWARLSEQASWAMLWQDAESGRWTAVGVGRPEAGGPPVLAVLVTDTDPP